MKVSILKSPKSAESGVTTLQFIQHRFCGGNAKSNKTHMVKIWWWWWSYCCLDSYVSCQSGPYFKGPFSKGVKTERTKNVPTSVLFTCMKWSVVAHLKISNHAGNSNLTMIPQSTLTQTHQRPQICSTINHGFPLTHSASLGKLQFTQVLFFKNLVR